MLCQLSYRRSAQLRYTNRQAVTESVTVPVLPPR